MGEQIVSYLSDPVDADLHRRDNPPLASLNHEQILINTETISGIKSVLKIRSLRTETDNPREFEIQYIQNTENLDNLTEPFEWKSLFIIIHENNLAIAIDPYDIVTFDKDKAMAACLSFVDYIDHENSFDLKLSVIDAFTNDSEITLKEA